MKCTFNLFSTFAQFNYTNIEFNFHNLFVYPKKCQKPKIIVLHSL